VPQEYWANFATDDKAQYGGRQILDMVAVDLNPAAGEGSNWLVVGKVADLPQQKGAGSTVRVSYPASSPPVRTAPAGSSRSTARHGRTRTMRPTRRMRWPKRIPRRSPTWSRAVTWRRHDRRTALQPTLDQHRAEADRCCWRVPQTAAAGGGVQLRRENPVSGLGPDPTVAADETGAGRNHDTRLQAARANTSAAVWPLRRWSCT
jgi:hypothetical protein